MKKAREGTKKISHDTPVLEEEALVDVYSLLVVEAHVVDGRQAKLVLSHILQVLVETHQLLLIIELRHGKA